MQEKILLFLKDNKLLSAAMIVSLTIILVTFFKLGRPPTQSPTVDVATQAVPSYVSAEERPTSKEEEDSSEHRDEITVDIKGAVVKPGVFAMKEGQRVIDLIEKAGGFNHDADQKQINLAKKLSDEELIYVPTLTETLESSSVMPTGSSDGNKINLNTATVSELQEIPGIGEKRAQDIIDYREQNGNFKTVDELKQVSGIGQKTLEKLEEYVGL